MTVSGDLLPLGLAGDGDALGIGDGGDSPRSEDGEDSDEEHQLVAIFDMEDASFSGSLSPESRKSRLQRISARSEEHPQGQDEDEQDESKLECHNRKKKRLQSTAAWAASGRW